MLQYTVMYTCIKITLKYKITQQAFIFTLLFQQIIEQVSRKWFCSHHYRNKLWKNIFLLKAIIEHSLDLIIPFIRLTQKQLAFRFNSLINYITTFKTFTTLTKRLKNFQRKSVVIKMFNNTYLCMQLIYPDANNSCEL